MSFKQHLIKYSLRMFKIISHRYNITFTSTVLRNNFIQLKVKKNVFKKSKRAITKKQNQKIIKMELIPLAFERHIYILKHNNSSHTTHLFFHPDPPCSNTFRYPLRATTGLTRISSSSGTYKRNGNVG